MCYMAVYPPGVMPVMEHLANGAELNPHGFGCSVGVDEVFHEMPAADWASPGVTPDLTANLSGETLNPQGRSWAVARTRELPAAAAEAAIAHFMVARAHRPEQVAIFHARYATGSSARTLANCQPLVLDDGTLVAHNGSLFPVWGPKSDTRVFADEFLWRWDLDREDDRRELRGLLGHNKMVVLRPGKVPVLLGDRLGVWHRDGSWHSNYDYTGSWHAAAGQCGACGKQVADAPAVSLCADCKIAYENRYFQLHDAR